MPDDYRRRAPGTDFWEQLFGRDLQAAWKKNIWHPIRGVAEGVGEFIAPTPPPTPDLTGAAREQAGIGAANVDAQTMQNRPTQTNPFGASTTWSVGPDGRPVQTTSLGGPLGDAANSLMGHAKDFFGQPLDFSSLGAMPTGFDPSSLPKGDPRSAAPDPYQARQQAFDAAYGQATSRLDPMWKDREEGMRTQLLNQGLTPGTEAYDKAMRNLSFERNDAYQSALNNATMQSTEAGDRLFRQGFDRGTQDLAARGLDVDTALRGASLGFDHGMTTRREGRDEILARREAPIRELTSLMPFLNMPGFSSAGAAPTPDLLGAAMGESGFGLERWRGINDRNADWIEAAMKLISATGGAK